MASPQMSRLKNMQDEVGELHPLLSKLLPKLPRVTSVDYTHGSDREMGADFVVARTDDVIARPEYIGVIAKVGKVVQDTTEIERQITECSVPRYFYGGKERIRLEEVWVVLTEHITRAAQEKIHELYKGRKITFINGRALETLIDRHLPTFWTDVTLEVGEYLTTLRTRNDELDKNVSMLQISDKTFYVDQDIYEAADYSKPVSRKPKDRKINIYDEIAHRKILLIEGGMGSGKSKFLRQLTRHYTDPQQYLQEQVLPVPIPYRQLVDEFDGNVSILIEKRVGEELGAELPKNTTYLLLIDAIDEKNFSPEEQVEKLEALILDLNERPNVKAVITSRYIKAIDQVASLQGVGSYELQYLSIEKTIEFITLLCSNLNLKDRILQDLKKSQLFKQMPHSPISAILLAKLLNEKSEDIPSNMTELYAKCLEFMLGRWDMEKGLELQKEYEASHAIMLRLAKYLIENEIPSLSPEETKGFFVDYLKPRNLGIDPDHLFRKVIERSDIMMRDPINDVIVFKHRTFVEFFYAQAVLAEKPVEVDHRVFQWYWMNSYFFMLGLLKDCPKELEAITDIEPESEIESWMKIINMANYFLAAYTTTYDVITECLGKVVLEAATLFVNITSSKTESVFSRWTRMQILWFMQFVMRDSYSFTFFEEAVETAALEIDSSNADQEVKSYALFLMNAIYIEIGTTKDFTFFLKNYKNLPLDVSLAIVDEGKRTKQMTAFMKKQDKHIKRLLKGNQGLQRQVKDLYERPVNPTKTIAS